MADDLTNGGQDEFSRIFREWQNHYENSTHDNPALENQRRMIWATRFYELGKKDGLNGR